MDFAETSILDSIISFVIKQAKGSPVECSSLISSIRLSMYLHKQMVSSYLEHIKTRPSSEQAHSYELWALDCAKQYLQVVGVGQKRHLS